MLVLERHMVKPWRIWGKPNLTLAQLCATSGGAGTGCVVASSEKEARLAGSEYHGR